MSTSSQHAFNPNLLDEFAIARALAHGEHAAVLQAYFGEPLYAQLQPMAKRALATPADTHTTVYLLPGLLGSRLAARTQRDNELLWLDPHALINGKLAQLAIGRRRSIKPIGVMLPGYLLLKLTLQAAGFNVRCHAYDWRRSVVDLGRQLAEEWLHDSSRNIMVVGHSMGGLVIRVALQLSGSAKVSRVIQVGAPNQGSWAMMQVLRACYPTVRKLGAIDHLHDAEALTRSVFHGFYSFYEMLPRLAQPSPWLQSAYWPQDGLRPMVERLKYARRLPRYLAAADQRCHAIVGTGQTTVSGIAQQSDEWLFEYHNDGDGTVPVALAQWSGAQHWYAQARHGWLPLTPAVCQGVIDLLQSGTTTSLLAQHTADTRVVARQSESQLRAQLHGKVRWDHLPMQERRELLEPVISSTFAANCT
jgi:pimeloyl-ACP methyl ester carboxylesterase